VLVVRFDPGADSRPRSLRNGVSIVESQEALVVSIMQRQGVARTVRLLGGGRDSLYDKFDPKRALDNRGSPVKEEESVEAMVGPTLVNVISR
jgi:hypothetical protein